MPRVGFVSLRAGARARCSPGCWASCGVDVFEAASWKGPDRLRDGRMLFAALALGKVELGTLGLVVEGASTTAGS